MSSVARQHEVTAEGTCDPRFAEVREQFERNFSERDELGASVCVIHEGQAVVDLWGGVADPANGSPWQADTLVVVFSCTKAATALCAHILASRGELDLDAPVRKYWPEFAAEGTEGITPRLLLNHQAGLPGLSEPVTPGDLLDFDLMAARMTRELPRWRPGTRYGYHALTFGWLVGEVVRRVSGETVGSFLRANVTEPLGIDFWIGLPAGDEHRVATTVGPNPGAQGFSPQFEAALARREPIQVAAVNSLGGLFEPGGCDAPGVHAAEIPAVNGIASARSLAGLYCPLSLGGRHGDVVLVDQNQIAQMTATESAAFEECVFFGASRHSAGFFKASPGRQALLAADGLALSEAAFGHPGQGGTVGFADPVARFSFGYVMNRHPVAGESEAARRQPLIDATYRALGYRTCESGKWV
jgi:CubicO group peptidase (beta-lactamase class C family)